MSFHDNKKRSAKDAEQQRRNKERIAIEALRQTETYLEELNDIAASADARAMAFTGFAGVMATLFLTLAPDAPSPVFAYIGAISVILGGIKTASSGSPRGFYSAGAFYADWEEHIADDDAFLEVIISQAKENDERIEHNNGLLEERASSFQSGVTLVIFATLVTMLIQLASELQNSGI
ncbi:hypothetical protein [Oceanicola sp. 502str15]|uniref:hypothetical protein n=1 Tax=Oceanicola sp. 502str15 TaxID=2696061 RepID=UPI00209510AB|nr:hypothetical protein [Oceanicola sp. 502str15]MCO6381329.1 hypothetical protein [Oceanicola sp. 502str15]